MGGVLDEVRAAAADIAAHAQFAHVRTEAIAAYARTLPLDKVRAPELDPATHYLREPEGTLAYVIQLDAINFGSGYFPKLRKRGSYSGYFTVAASLKDAFEARGPLGATDLQRLTAEDCAGIFGQDPLPDASIGELMSLFARALNDLGRYVSNSYAGSLRTLVEAADGSAERLVGLLSAMEFYRDVPFYKRAQLTAADLATANVAQFPDLDRLTIFADNLVPHVLRVDGVLDYEAGLLQRINREELIPAGSREEREIRGCAVHAVELIKTALANQVTAMQLDYLLWNRGQLAAYKTIPRHRARTVYY
jgi:Queuosine salvage protein